MPQFVIRKFDDIESGPSVKPSGILVQELQIVLCSAGIPEFQYHDLRHYTASIMHALNIPDQYIMKRGGCRQGAQKVYRGTIDIEEKKFT